MAVQREQLEADVLIVGAGPAGLSCALHLANLIKKHNEGGGKPELSSEDIYVLEKGREIGAHQLSGAIMNPKALAELVPDFEKTAPLDTPVTDSAALFFTEEQRKLRHFAEQNGEVARRTRGKGRRKSIYAVRRRPAHI
jgi:electron-transferring-flavoprotein dehydrogenase